MRPITLAATLVALPAAADEPLTATGAAEMALICSEAVAANAAEAATACEGFLARSEAAEVAEADRPALLAARARMHASLAALAMRRGEGLSTVTCGHVERALRAGADADPDALSQEMREEAATTAKRASKLARSCRKRFPAPDWGVQLAPE